MAELEAILAQVGNGRHLAVMLEHLGPTTSAGMIRQWMAKSKFAPMNQFLERLAQGVGKELAETTGLHGNSIVIDSNMAIALMKDADPALRPTMQAGEEAWVAALRTLSKDADLRVANVTVGEIRSGALQVKGIPIETLRESAEYQKVLKILADRNVGKAKGVADRGLIADAFFARTEAGVTSRTLVTADPGIVTKLADMATPPIDVVKKGLRGIVAEYGPKGTRGRGFDVIIEGRTLTVIPVQ